MYALICLVDFVISYFYIGISAVISGERSTQTDLLMIIAIEGTFAH